MKRLIALAVIVGFLSSCATLEDQGKLEGCGIGALGGAALGAVIGVLAGGGRGAAIGAGAGAVGGCVTGYVLANQIVKHREELAGKENDLDARIEFARNVNQDTEAYNKQLASDVTSYEAKIDSLKKKNENLARTQEELKVKSADAQKQLTTVEKALVELKTFRTQNVKSASKGSPPPKDLDAEIAKLEATVKQLRNNTTALANQSQRI